jgi:hypothetical protein
VFFQRDATKCAQAARNAEKGRQLNGLGPRICRFFTQAVALGHAAGRQLSYNRWHEKDLPDRRRGGAGAGGRRRLVVDAARRAADVQYRTARSNAALLATVSASGAVNPVTQVSVGTQVSGQIKDLLRRLQLRGQGRAS